MRIKDIASLLARKVAVASVPSMVAADTIDENSVINTVKNRDSVRAAIHMDAMAFGMGCCCLQITFQAKDMDESRFMYDQWSWRRS
jgi:hypothetical protein